MGGRLLDGITLTDAQKAQQVTIREKYMPKMTEMRQQMMSAGGPPDSASRAQMMALQAQYNADIRAILTPDQQKVFDKNLADEKERMANRRPPPGN
jgi:periplasmic protein CpxP/Spy